MAGRPRAVKAAAQFAFRAVGFGPELMFRESQGSVAVVKEVDLGRKTSVIAGARKDRLWVPRIIRSLMGFHRRP